MNPILNRNVYFVKEHVGIFKAANNYDIYDPESNKIILECREESLGFSQVHGLQTDDAF